MVTFVKSIFRNLWKYKSMNALNIGGLAVGIASAALIFLWVEDEVTFDSHLEKKDYLYSVKENQVYDDGIFTVRVTPGPMAPALKADIPGIKNSARTSGGSSRTLLKVDNNSFYEYGNYVDSSFLSMFSVTFLEGNARHAFDQLQSIVISENLESKFFPNQRALGKVIKMEGELFTVSGVIKDLPSNASVKFDWLVPFDLITAKYTWMSRWDANGVMTYVELDKNASVDVINKRLETYLKEKSDNETKCFLFPASNWHLYDSFKDGVYDGGGQIKYVRLFSIIAWIVIIAACINFMVLATSRSERRSKEVGVRKSLGATRQSLISQFLIESLVMAFISIVVAIGLIAVSLDSFNILVEKQLALRFSSPLHIGGLLSIGLICGLLAGSYPAVYLSSFNPSIVLKGLKSATSTSAVFIRKALVVSQFSISIGMIICTIIIYQQIQHTKNRKLGYQKDKMIYLDVRGNLQEHFGAVKNELLNTGKVEDVALSVNPIIEYGWYSSSNYSWAGSNPENEILITVEAVTPEYINTHNLALVEGRDFNKVATKDVDNVIINKSLAAIMGKGSQVGSVIKKSDSKEELKVIGVVDDFVFGNVYSGDVPPMIMTCNLADYHTMTIRLKENAELSESIAGIGAVMTKASPDFPFEYKFLDSEFDKQFKTESLIEKISKVFAILSISISCLGLFGLASYTIARRTKEIGVRKVLGATSATLFQLLSKDFLMLIIIACAISFPVALYFMNNWLLGYEYRTQIYWWVFAIAGCSTLVISMMIIGYHTIKATLVDPVNSLRSE